MKNRFIPFLLVFFCSLCFGLFFIVIFMNATEVNCIRQADETYTCHITTLFFGKVKTFERTEEHIVGIVMEKDSCDDGCAFRAEFVTANGKQIPLSSVYTDQGTVAERVSEIGSQIDRGAQTITYTVGLPWWVLYLVGGLMVMALLLSSLLLRKRNTR